MWYDKNIAAMHAARRKRRETLYRVFRNEVDGMVDRIMSAERSIDREELVAVADVALVRAVNRGLRGTSCNRLLEEINKEIADFAISEIEHQNAMAPLDTLEDIADDIGFEDVAANIADSLDPWLVERIYRAIDELPVRHQMVLEHRFELHGKPRLTYSQLAIKLGRSVERARKMEHEAVEMLREAVSYFVYYI